MPVSFLYLSLYATMHKLFEEAVLYVIELKGLVVKGSVGCNYRCSLYFLPSHREVSVRVF
jgi:hypothetical protein